MRNLQYILDNYTLSQLIIFVLLVTVAFALGYYCLDVYVPHHGLVRPDGEQKSLASCLYFSVTTQTTLGYGDIRPIGLSRMLACGQVAIGLATAGLIVAKLTTLPHARLRYIASRLEGHWIDFIVIDNGQKVVALEEFRMSSGVLTFSGRNYDTDGSYKGVFTSQLILEEWPVLKFKYTNLESSTDDFCFGEISLRFSESKHGNVVGFVGYARDFVKKNNHTLRARRLDSAEEECWAEESKAGEMVRIASAALLGEDKDK